MRLKIIFPLGRTRLKMLYKKKQSIKNPVFLEAIIDTSTGLPLAWGVSFLILLIADFLKFENLLAISCAQTVVLTVVSLLRKVFIRKKFKKMGF